MKGMPYRDLEKSRQCTRLKGGLTVDNLPSHSGYIHSKGDRHFSYDFINGELIIHVHSEIPEIEGKNMVLVKSYDNKFRLLYSQVPIKIADYAIYPQNYKHKIDCAIESFEIGSKYHRAIFSFDELQYFCSSSQVVRRNGDEVTFIMNPKEIHSFDFYVDEKKCHTAFVVKSEGTYGVANSHMNTTSEIVIDFEETGNVLFLEKIYHVVDFAFAFICNRKNITCTSMKLIGKCPSKGMEHGKIIDCTRDIRSNMLFYDRYREAPENDSVISKTFYAKYMLKYDVV